MPVKKPGPVALRDRPGAFVHSCRRTTTDIGGSARRCPPANGNWIAGDWTLTAGGTPRTPEKYGNEPDTNCQQEPPDPSR